MSYYRQNVLPEYKTVGEPITVTAREPRSRDELRITRTQRADEEAPRVDIRLWTLHTDGRETAHQGGLRITYEEAAKLRDALNDLDL